MSDFKRFTNAQYNAMTNEFVRLAREFAEKGFDASISFCDDHSTIFVHDENSCACMLYFRKDRYFSREEYNELVEIAKKANVELKGRYVTMMANAVKSEENGEYLDF